MARIPTTSETLLRDISGDLLHPRWTEFAGRYRPMMEELVEREFPGVEADEIIQQTLLALARILPGYRYRPGEKGYFHSYLSKILRNKCIDALRREGRREELARRHLDARIAAGEVQAAASADDGDGEGAAPALVLATGGEAPGASIEEWLQDACHIALQQLEAETMERNPKHWHVFRRTWLDGEPPAAVADSLLLPRPTVDQIKKRMLGRLEEMIRALRELERV